MNQADRRLYLIRELLKEYPGQIREIPEEASGQRRLLRSLMNVRRPCPVGREFLKIQDAYLREETAAKGITDLDSLEPVEGDFYLWRGDITTLRCDAVVNAANRGLTGCYVPCHGCIDNCIHTFSGIQLRLACARLMEDQGHEEETGKAKVTPAFNLPCRYVIHTVGPVVTGRVTEEDERLLRSCYRSCLEAAEEYEVDSLAFCCISTGEFHFPGRRAARIGVETVRDYKQETNSHVKIIFNVYKEADYEIYRELLGAC